MPVLASVTGAKILEVGSIKQCPPNGTTVAGKQALSGLILYEHRHAAACAWCWQLGFEMCRRLDAVVVNSICGFC